MSDTEKRCVGFPGDADFCGRSERIEIANGNRNSFSTARNDSRSTGRDDSRDPAAATGSGKATGRAAAGTD